MTELQLTRINEAIDRLIQAAKSLGVAEEANWATVQDRRDVALARNHLMDAISGTGRVV